MLNVAVIGAGLMGHGIAWLMARAGHRVAVQDLDEAARSGLQDRLLRLNELLADGAPLPHPVTVHESLADAVSGADLVFEAVSENPELKQEIFAALERLAPSDAILCSNTSAIPISRIAERVVNRARVVGTHFWNPPHLVDLVEVVQMADENLPAVQRVIGILRAAGRSPVHVRKDIPGFIGNRLQHALKREAIALVAAGVCDAETLDTVVKSGFGSRMAVLGPMEQSDLVGLDLTLAISRVLVADLDRADAPHPYLVAQVEAGHLGMKSGQGFYNWTAEQSAEVHHRLEQALLAKRR